MTNQISVSYLAALIFALAVALLGGLSLFLKHTSLGRAIRATAEDPDTAELVGINARAVYAVAAAIAVATVALAGTMLAMRATFDPYSGPMQLIFAFEAVVIGGIGSLWGTLVGGIVLGLAQSIGAAVRPEVVPARGPSDISRGARPSPVPGMDAGARRPALGARARRMSEAPTFSVERWTRESAAFGVAVAIIVVALAVAPLIGSANVVDKLTTLFVYVILAAMWNALAGYAGLVSVGQQAFFGIGAYFAIRLVRAAAFPPIRRCSPGRSARRCWRSRSPSSCCACAAASSRSACGCSPRRCISWSTSTR